MINRRQSGFTIIELTLSVIFVSVLLLLVATITIHIGGLYEKGITMKSLNQVGREVMDILRRDISQAGESIEFRVLGSGKSTTYRLCLGDVSYVANSGESLNASTGTKLRYENQDPVVFARLTNSGASSFCNLGAGGAAETVVSSGMQASELLTIDGGSLAVHAFDVQLLSQSASQSLYKVTLTIGTNEQGTLDSDLYCRPGNNNATDYGANFNYCSVAEFTTIIRSGGDSV